MEYRNNNPAEKISSNNIN